MFLQNSAFLFMLKGQGGQSVRCDAFTRAAAVVAAVGAGGWHVHFHLPAALLAGPQRPAPRFRTRGLLLFRFQSP